MKIKSNTIFSIIFISIIFLFFNCKNNNQFYSNDDLKLLTPKDNVQTEDKIELGKKLFFDKRLSKNNSISCSSCHEPSKAFTDGKKVSTGVFGRITNRNSPTLFNVGYYPKLMFDAELSTLELQVIVPIQEHNEMGMNMKELIRKLKEIPEYNEAANKIFNRDFDPWVLTRSISAYERTLISMDSRFDRFYYKNEKNSLNKNEQKGWKLFSEKLHCIQCHQPPLFTNLKAENNGLISDNEEDKGRFRIHSDSNDIGKFKVPTLRNIQLTAPYMHDGRLSTLNEVIKHYKNGGISNRNKNNLIQKFDLNSKEEEQLIQFLNSLTEINLEKYN